MLFGKENSARRIEGSRKRGRPNVLWIDSIKEAIDTSLQELNEAVEDKTLWTALIHSVVRSQSQVNGKEHVQFQK